MVIPVDAWPAGNRSLLSALYQDVQGICQSMDQTHIGLADQLSYPLWQVLSYGQTTHRPVLPKSQICEAQLAEIQLHGFI